MKTDPWDYVEIPDAVLNKLNEQRTLQLRQKMLIIDGKLQTEYDELQLKINELKMKQDLIRAQQTKGTTYKTKIHARLAILNENTK